MALYFFDTVQLGSATEAGWDSGSVYGGATTGGPFGDRYTNRNNFARTLGANLGTIIIGYWWRYLVGGVGQVAHWRLCDGATVQCQIEASATTGALSLRNGTGGTVLLTTGTFTASVWRHVEWKIPIGNSVNVEVRVDGVTVGTATGVDTTTTANNTVSFIKDLQTGSFNDFQWNNLHVADTTGTGVTDFIGPTKGYALIPNGDGNYTQWTPLAGTRWQAVDDWSAFGASDGDSTYISDNTAGHKNSVTLTNTVAGLGTIYGLMHSWVVRRDDAGPHTARAFIRSSTTDTVESTESITATFVPFAYFHEFSVFTGGSTRWTASEVDGLELGVEVVT